MRRAMRPAAGPLSAYTMAVSEPIVVEAITSFVDQMVVTAKQPNAGESVITANSNLKVPLQHAQVATFIEKKVNAILFFLITAAGWEADVKNATSQGIAAFNHSASAVSGMTQNAGLDQYGAGYGLGTVAAQWMNKNQGGTGEWALLAITNDPQLLLRGKGVAAAMTKLAPNAKLVGTQFAQLETQGASAASNFIQANPNLKMLLSAGDDPAFGAYTVGHGLGQDRLHGLLHRELRRHQRGSVEDRTGRDLPGDLGLPVPVQRYPARAGRGEICASSRSSRLGSRRRSR